MQSITNTVDAGNGQKRIEHLIGTVTVTEAFTVRTSEQTACNYYEIEVAPGVYDVVLHGGGAYPWVIVKYTGTIVDEHWVNRLFGSSSLAEKRSIGQPSTRAAAQMNNYIAAEQFATNPAWELAEDWTVEMTQRYYEDGRSRKAFKLVEPIF